MPRLADLPARALLVFAGIVLVVAFASRRPSAFVLLQPDTLAAVLFLYIPLFHYRRGPVPPWLKTGDLRRSALVFLPLLLGGAAVYLAYARLPLPPGAAPPRGAMPPAAEFLVRQVLFAAIPEEIFFRGYLYDAFEERGWEPVVLTSALFAVGHIAIRPSPYRAMTFFPSLLFGWARRKSGNVHVPIALHLAFNAFPYLPGV